MQFVPLVGTTLGLLGVDIVAMSWGLAHRAAKKAFLARGLNTVSPTTAPQHCPHLPCPVPRWRLSWPAR
eukprot:587876-Rhodomonas_salina.1